MELLELIGKYANLINMGLFVPLIVLIWRFAKMTNDYKDAQKDFTNNQFEKILIEKEEQINTLKESLVFAEKKSIKNMNDEIDSVSAFHEKKMKIQKEKWLEESKKNIESHKKEVRKELHKELEQREEMVVKENLAKFSLDGNKSIAKSKVAGKYSILGINPGSTFDYYYGVLSIRFKKDHIRATWEISGSQKQVGYGFKLNNHLVISFSYLDDKDGQRVGIVAYEFINEKIMRGKWTLKHLPFLGFEECRKLDKDEIKGDNILYK